MSDDAAALRQKVQDQYAIDPARAVARFKVRSGATFQQELDTTHQSLLTRHVGAIYRHARETVGAPPTAKNPAGSLKFKKGGNPVDYTGHVNIRPRTTAAGWELCQPADRGCISLPVAFDAKRESSALTYHCRETDQKHQLIQLRDAAAAGAAAFLLVHVVMAQAVFIIGRPEYINTLLAGGTVRLVDSKSRTHLLPSVTWRNAEGWPYAAELPQALGIAGRLRGMLGLPGGT